MSDDGARETIREAILSHIRWKERIEHSIRHAKHDIDIGEVGDCKACSFGNWLHSDHVPQKMRASQYYQIVCKMHSDFHLRASQLVSASKISSVEEFGKIFIIMHEYTSLSDALVKTLEIWWQDSDGH